MVVVGCEGSAHELEVRKNGGAFKAAGKNASLHRLEFNSLHAKLTDPDRIDEAMRGMGSHNSIFRRRHDLSKREVKVSLGETEMTAISPNWYRTLSTLWQVTMLAAMLVGVLLPGKTRVPCG